jgi:hypothetical protein
MHIFGLLSVYFWDACHGVKGVVVFARYPWDGGLEQCILSDFFHEILTCLSLFCSCLDCGSLLFLCSLLRITSSVDYKGSTSPPCTRWMACRDSSPNQTAGQVGSSCASPYPSPAQA